MPLKLTAAEYPSAVLLGTTGQSERDKYAAHSRQLPVPPGVDQPRRSCLQGKRKWKLRTSTLVGADDLPKMCRPRRLSEDADQGANDLHKISSDANCYHVACGL